MSDVAIAQFSHEVDSEYKSSFEDRFINWSVPRTYLLNAKKLAIYYQQFETMFPTCHFLLAMIVSSQYYKFPIQPLPSAAASQLAASPSSSGVAPSTLTLTPSATMPSARKSAMTPSARTPSTTTPSCDGYVRQVVFFGASR